MNQFFSSRRFSLVVLKHWADNKKRYTLSVLAFIGLLTGWFTFSIILRDDHGPMSGDFQQATFFFLFFFGGALYASYYFSNLALRTRATNFFLLPASAFEKFLCSLLFSVVLFFTVFTAAFYLVDVLMVNVSNNIPYDGPAVPKAKVINIFAVDFFNFSSRRGLNFLLFFFSVQAVFLFGSVYFKKYNFLKTVISCFVIWFIAVVVLFALYEWLDILNEDEMLPDWSACAVIVLAYSIAPLFWILTYYRLKAKQV
jgi:hypothetical protein